jgi:uncharacterized protein YrrD
MAPLVLLLPGEKRCPVKDLLDFKGRLVVTRDEGARLGVTSGLIVDEAVGRVSAVLFRKKWRFADQWVSTSEVVSVGPDLVVVTSKHKVHASKNAGRRLADYRGRWVTTISGEHLGRLADVGTAGKDWSVYRLEFDDGSSVEMDGTEMVFGRDEILTPDRFEKHDAKRANGGLVARLRRIFGSNDDNIPQSDARGRPDANSVLPIDPRGPINGPDRPSDGERKTGSS